MPFLPCEEVETKEETSVAETDGQWTVPLRLFEPQWGQPLGIMRRLVDSSGKVEDCQRLFSTTMPPCVDVQKVKKQHITRVVRTMEVNVDKTVDDGSECDVNPTANDTRSDVMSSVSQRDVFQKNFPWLSAKDLEDNSFDEKKLDYFKTKMQPAVLAPEHAVTTDPQRADRNDAQMSIASGNLREVSGRDANAPDKCESSSAGRTYALSKSIGLG